MTPIASGSVTRDVESGPGQSLFPARVEAIEPTPAPSTIGDEKASSRDTIGQDGKDEKDGGQDATDSDGRDEVTFPDGGLRVSTGSLVAHAGVARGCRGILDSVLRLWDRRGHRRVPDPLQVDVSRRLLRESNIVDHVVSHASIRSLIL